MTLGIRPVVALAGRRIDAPGAKERFPLAQVPAVRIRLRELMLEVRPAALVCSAACGADLLALDVAGQLGVRRRIVVPFEVERFRETSVVDRPGAWGVIYDRVVAETRAAGDLVVLAGAGDDEAAYVAANEAILDEATTLAGAQAVKTRVVAVLVWDGQRRVGGVTGLFADSARRRRLEVREIPTCPGVISD